MKLPVAPPNFWIEIQRSVTESTDFMSRLSDAGPVDAKGRYLHWDKLRHLEPPLGLSSEQWWAATRYARRSISQTLPLSDTKGSRFTYAIPGLVQKELHWFDLYAAGNMTGEKQVANPNMQTTYLIKTLVEEAISSSQLEGASTTRNVAREMIRQGREPKDKSERMILNNFRAMQFIREVKGEKLTPSIIRELHKILTENTLDNPAKAGEYRTPDDDIHVVDEEGQILHTPPHADELDRRMATLCDFANGKFDQDFIHPVIKAIMLHFMLAYDHPFVDGNGRTARALFYWMVASQKYWLMEFISISTIIKKAPVKYGKAFLYTETDDNDLTYFIVHQVEVIRRAIESLHAFLEKKMEDLSYAESLLQNNTKLRGKLNFRQLALLRHALKHPRFVYNINEHQNSHGVVYETARRDLLQMSDALKLLIKLKSGKSFVFISPENLEERLAKH